MKSSFPILAVTLALSVLSGSFAFAQVGQEAYEGEDGTPVTLSSSEIFGEASFGSAYVGGGCNEDCAGFCDSCRNRPCPCPQCRGGVFRSSWASVDFVHAWTKGSSLPVLVSTSAAGTTPDDAGVFPPDGVASTRALFGGDRVGDERQSGGRVDLGFWLNHGNGVGIRLFALEGDRTSFNQPAAENPILANPFFNVGLNQNDSFLINVTNLGGPGWFRGSVGVATSNDVFFGDAYLRMCMASGAGYKIDFLAGYQMGRIDDSVQMTSFRTVLVDPDGVLPAGTTQRTSDSFVTENEFHMLSLGAATQVRHNRFSLKGLVKMSLGNVNQRVDIAGSTVLNGGATASQGLFARNSNIGSYANDRFTYLPEVGFTLGYDITCNLQLNVGYTFMYMPHIILAGDQIDTSLDIPGGTRPVFNFRETDFWVQGVTLGGSLAY